MKGIATLIKLRQRELDEKKRELAAMQQKKEVLEMVLITIDTETASEALCADKNPEMAEHFSKFMKKQRIKKQATQEAIRTNDILIAQKQDDIFISFTELKKLEIAKSNSDQKKKFAAEKKAADFMDEMATGRFIREHE